MGYDSYFILFLNYGLMCVYFSASTFVSFTVVFLNFIFQDAWIIHDRLFDEADFKSEGKFEVGEWFCLGMHPLLGLENHKGRLKDTEKGKTRKETRHYIDKQQFHL